MAIETNLNQQPYYDDFNENKDFHRLLFRPGFGVQARELTQLQTIMQTQLERFANEVVIDGTVITGCGLSTDTVGFVKLRDKDANNRVLLLGDFFTSGKVANAIVEGVTSGVQGRLVDVKEGSEAGAPNFLTIYVAYTNSGANNTTKTFLDNESLVVRNFASSNAFMVAANTIASSATGLALRGSLSDGVVYHKGTFLRVANQSIIIGKYTHRPDKKVGLRTIETIVDSNADSSLLDNATGATNFAAPGANRLKMVPTLAVYDKTFANTENFFQIAQISGGSVEQRNEDTTYSDIGRYIAEQAYDTNGNYVTDPFNLRIREHLHKANSLGRYSSSEGGDKDKLVVEVEKGRGYVNGFRVQQYGASYIEFDKALQANVTTGTAISQSLGNYVLVDEVAGSWDMQELKSVSIRQTAANALTNGTVGSTSAAGSEIGTARVRGFEWHSGTKGTPACQYRLYLFDIQMNAGKNFQDAKNFYIANSAGTGVHAHADSVLVSSKTVLKEAGLLPSVFNTGFFATKEHANRQFVVRKKFQEITVATDGTASATLNTDGGDTRATGGSEDFNDGGATIALADFRNYMIVNRTSAKTLDKTGTISSISGTTVTGSGTAFTTEYKVGDLFNADISAAETDIGYIASIDSDTQITLVANALATSVSSSAHRIHFPPGHIHNLQYASGILSESVNGTLQIALARGTFTGTFNIDIYFDVLRTSAAPAKKTVFKDKYIHINTGSHSASKNGPWSLGVSDAWKITGVFKGSNTGVVTTNTDVTDQFELVTGQKDAMYDTSFLKQKDTSSLDLTDCGLMVKFNYFGKSISTGYGFFTKDSYTDIIDDANPDAASSIVTQEIPIYQSPTTGRRFDLRDSVDFRPKKTNTVTPSSTGTVASAPTNPAVLTAFDFDSNNGAYQPSPDENYQADIWQYMPRRDRVVISQRGNFEVVKGVASKNPRTPPEPAGTMTLGIVDVTPYPSLSPYVANHYNRPLYRVNLDLENNRRYTMKDLRQMERRIKNLEYYTSLSALETAAQNKQIFTAGGAERFKNGFFVDSFTGLQFSDTTDPAQRAGIDRTFSRLIPKFKRRDIKLKKDVDLTSTNITQTGDILSLPYTHEALVEQPYATKLRNPVQELLFNWRGEVILQPEADNTPDITQAPDVQIDFSGINDALVEIMELTGIEEGVFREVDTQGRRRTITTTTISDIVSTAETIDFGNVITDVSLREYMRSIEIKATGVRIRPNTRVYAYFDDEKVSAYCTPTDANFNPTGVEGDPLITGDDGTVTLLFRLPNDEDLKFRAGTKQFKLQDIEDPVTEASLVTTSAIGSFTSQGLNIVQQGTSVNMVFPQIIKDVRVATQTLHTVADGDRSWWDPLAQSFNINVSGTTDGVFITKLDLFFGKKSSTLPVTVQIRQMETGFPTKTIVPYGQKTLNPADINIDTGNLANPTTFTFDNPVFLKNNEDYSLVILPAGNSDDYALWVAELGGTDVNTNLLIPKQVYPGVLFTSANDNTWNPIQSEDLAMRIYRAKFDTTATGTVIIQNSDTDYIQYDNRKGNFRIGETVRAESVMTFANNKTVAVGDILFSKESANTLSSNFANGTIRQIVSSGSGSVTVKVDAFGDFPTTASSNTNNLYLNSAGRADAAFVGNTSSFTANTATGKVHFIFDSASPKRMHVTDVVTTVQTGAGGHYGFANNNTWIRGQRSGATLRSTQLEDLPLNTLKPMIPEIRYPRTFTQWEAKTTDTSGTIDSKYQIVDLGTTNFFTDEEKKVFSASKEETLTAVGGSKKTLTIKGTLTTEKDSLSPIIDTSRMNASITENVINNLNTGETAPSGNSQVRYISNVIELDDGQDAEDITVYLSAFKPQTTGIDVYARVLNAEDPEGIKDKKFSKLRQVTSANVFSTGVNTNEGNEDVREFEYTFQANTDGQNFLANSSLNTAFLDTADNDIVGYTNSDGSIYKTYKSYQIKIVMTAAGTNLTPFVQDLRAIALQK